MTKEEIERATRRLVGKTLADNFGRAAESLIVAAAQLFYLGDELGAEFDEFGGTAGRCPETAARDEFLKACERARRPRDNSGEGGEIVVAIALRTLLYATGANGVGGLLNAVYGNEEIDAISTQTHGDKASVAVEKAQARAWREFMAKHCK